MAAGTAAALVPIKSITMRSRNDKFVYQNNSDEPGPANTKLIQTLQGIQRGKIDDSFGWNATVQEPKKGEYETEEENTNGVGHEMVDKLP